MTERRNRPGDDCVIWRAALILFAVAMSSCQSARRCACDRIEADPNFPQTWARAWSDPVGSVRDGRGLALRVVRRADEAEMILVQAGQFTQGVVAGGEEDQRPVHTATIHRAFYMDCREVTIGQWKRVMGCRPHWISDRAWESAPDRPVGAVNYFEAIDYAHRVGAELPSESEWEYVARLGSNVWQFPWGPEDDVARRSLSPTGWISAASVRPPQVHGFYDLIGNVEEWCSDFYVPYERLLLDPSLSSTCHTCVERVVRGDSYLTPSALDLIARRRHSDPAWTWEGLGFRCVVRVP